MTNEEEHELKRWLEVWRNDMKIYGQISKKDMARLLDAATDLLKENSELRVRDSNVTAHSLNVMAVNEDLLKRWNRVVAKLETACKKWESDDDPYTEGETYREAARQVREILEDER